jgi:hypothetical protein
MYHADQSIIFDHDDQILQLHAVEIKLHARLALPSLQCRRRNLPRLPIITDQRQSSPELLFRCDASRHKFEALSRGKRTVERWNHRFNSMGRSRSFAPSHGSS